MAAPKSSHSREAFWLDAWYQGRWWLWLFWPLSLLLRWVAGIRRRHLQEQAKPFTAPVIVVGNITLGGTGKTPVIIALVRYLKEQGLRPGVISRGYGGSAPSYPYFVSSTSPVSESGDEPLLIAMEADCPVMVGADRNASVHKLISEHQCNVILSDDGMQHYKLSRQWEICLLDGARLLGNGLCLPAGPLREGPERLKEVDCVIVNGSQQGVSVSGVEALPMSLQPKLWCNVLTGEQLPLDSLPFAGDTVVNAVTGIGNPERFYKTLKDLNIAVRGQSFPDHHAFQAEDLAYVGSRPLLMTAKDAVKCQSFAKPDWWYLSVEAELPAQFYDQFSAFLSKSGVPVQDSDSAVKG